MGKRSDFERKPRDFYPTPLEAVEPLIPHFDGQFTFTEPCAGNVVLVDHLESNGGHCTWCLISTICLLKRKSHLSIFFNVHHCNTSIK